MAAKSISARLAEAKKTTPASLASRPEEVPPVAQDEVSTTVPATDKMSKIRAARAVPPDETREEKLIRLANARVTKACKYIALVGNLAGYKPTPGQVDKIMAALGESCARVNNRLDGVRRESITFQIM